MDDQINDIIARKFQGTATPQDLTALEQWLAASDSNRHEFEQMQLIWEKGGEMFPAIPFNTAAAWDKVDNSIRRKEKKAMVFPLKRLAIAVAFLVAVFTGWYFWRSGDASMQKIMATKAMMPVTLPDGSSVFLRKGSTIEFAASFDGAVRRVQLKGEAWFQVEHNAKQPFLISTDNSTIKVLGTSFLVHSTDKADEVIVSSGKVSMSGKHTEGRQVILTAGQKAVLANGELLQETVSDSNYLAWKTGLLEFRNTPLAEALDAVADYYDLPIVLPDTLLPAAELMHINARFRDQPVSEVLEEIKLATGLSTKEENGQVIFFRK
ncbi:MAG: FecR family protein [Pseudobacter sp.]|uniref:FecR family protein n=1 Tax=Pseudobacter sp. TaxID=2045420 RepID=UPI003F7FBE33